MFRSFDLLAPRTFKWLSDLLTLSVHDEGYSIISYLRFSLFLLRFSASPPAAAFGETDCLKALLDNGATVADRTEWVTV
jgi:hypothetical protein